MASLSAQNYLATRVLVVEDNDGFSAELCEALKSNGMDVRCTSTAEDAMPLLVDWKPHYLVCDVHLPGLSGERLSNLVRSLNHKLLIVMMSADHAALERINTENSHLPLMSLAKPFDIHRLLSVVGQSK